MSEGQEELRATAPCACRQPQVGVVLEHPDGRVEMLCRNCHGVISTEPPDVSADLTCVKKRYYRLVWDVTIKHAVGL